MKIEKNSEQPLVNNRFFKDMPEDVLRSSPAMMRAVLLMPNDQAKIENSEELAQTPSM
jgi:hypothetical protein